MDSKFSFDWMIAPVSRQEFFNSYFEKKHLHIKNRDRNYYNDLLSQERIDDFIYNNLLRHPNVRMTKHDEEIKADQYTVGDRILPSQLLKLFSEGSTLILAALHEYISTLGVFVSQLTKETGHKYQTNIYITPKNSQGFNVHYDTHDVFVLQVKGKKKWRIYDQNPIVLPNKLQEFVKDKYEVGPLADEFILEQGEMLYIPRGIMHDADTMDETSIHITTGLLGYTLNDLIVEGLLNLSKNESYLRHYVPMDWMANDEPADDRIKEIFRNVLQKISTDLDFSAVKSRMRGELIRNQKVNLAGLLNTSDLIDTISSNQRFQKRNAILFFTSTNAENITIEWLGKKINFPIHTEPAVTYVLNNNEDFSIQQIPDCLDEPGKIVLVKRLIKEGLLEVIN